MEQLQVAAAVAELAGSPGAAAGEADVLVGRCIDASGRLAPGALEMTAACLDAVTSNAGGDASIWAVLARIAEAADALGGDPYLLQEVRGRLEARAVVAAEFVVGSSATDPAVVASMRCLQWMLGFVDEPKPIATLLKKFAKGGAAEKKLAREVREGPCRLDG